MSRGVEAGDPVRTPVTGLRCEMRWFLRERGFSWALLHLLRDLLTRVLRWLERRMIEFEKRHFITGPGTIASGHHTTEQNRWWWNEYDWSHSGEEWTRSVSDLRGLDPEEWKQAIVHSLMFRYIRPGIDVLEIGPGAGRWTQHLQPISRRLVLADISERCIELCRARFAGCSNVEYNVVKGGKLAPLDANSVDAVWSYDAFVHINPTDTDLYLGEIRRVLRPGGIAIIHHPGNYASDAEARRALRSHIDGPFFAHLVEKHEMEVLEQNATLPHFPGDLISVFRKRSFP